MAMCRALFGLVLVAACGPKAAPAAPPEPGGGSAAAPAPAVVVDAAPPVPLTLDRDYPRVVARSIELYEQLLAAFRTAGTDCAAAATAVKAVAATYADVIAANATIVREERVAELKVALAPHEARFTAAAKAVIEAPTLGTCAKDAGFTAAFTELVGPPP